MPKTTTKASTQTQMEPPAPLRTLGRNGPQVPSIGLGLMAIGAHYGTPSTQAEVDALLDAAYASGARFWDTSDVYGDSESKIGSFLARHPTYRPALFLSSKYGYTRLPRPPSKSNTFSAPCSLPSYIPQALEASLKRLNTDYLDIYFQHRVDPQVPIELVMEALRPAVKSGKVRYLGLSECSPATLRRAKAVPGVGDKLVAVQMEYSPFTLDVETNGLGAACRELGVAVVCYSPLGRGLVSGCYRSRADLEPTDGRLWLPRFSAENFDKNLRVVDYFKEVADELTAARRAGAKEGEAVEEVTPAQVGLAWILAEHEDYVPIPGTRSPLRLQQNTLAARLTLPPHVQQKLRALVDAAEVAGARYMPALMGEVEGECISLVEWKGEGAVEEKEGVEGEWD